jgi:hypothetical protein
VVGTPPAALEVVKLDAAGQPTSSALRVTPPGAEVGDFELAALGDSAIIFWRSATPTAGGGGRLHQTRVAADGSVTSEEVGVRELGPGAPLVLASTAEGAWISVSDDRDRPLIWWVPASLRGAVSAEQLRVDEALATSSPLVASGDDVLFMRYEDAKPVLFEGRCRR